MGMVKDYHSQIVPSKVNIPREEEMKSQVRRVWVISVVLLLAVIAVSNVAAAGGAESAGVPTDAGAASGAEPKGYQKDIVIGLEQGITTADPHKLSNVQHNVLFNLVHDRLLSLDENTMSFHPELAISWKWTTPTVLELVLRQDVKFHDGTPFTAHDVVFTLERAKAIGTTISAKFGGLKLIEAVDNHTVRMTLAKPNVDWLDTLAHPMASIISKAAVEANPSEGGYIGTGAWVVKTLKPSDYISLARNDAYWTDLPKTETLTIRYIPEDSARLIALQNGEVDVCINVLSTEIKFITDDPKLSLVQYNSTSLEYFSFNTSKAPGNDQNLRLAVAHALDYDDIMTVAAGGLGTRAVTFWGPKTYGFYDGFGPYKKDLALARQYLAKSYPQGGAKLEINVSGALKAATAQLIQDQLKQIGLTITINEMEGAALTASSAFKTAKYQSMLYNIGWNSAGDDARRPYYAGSNSNKATLTNERIMELIDKAVMETDDTARKAMYREIQEINHEQAYWIPLFTPILSVGVKKNLDGVIWKAHRSHDFSYINLPIK
jgi:peptide/nickel transport system substrate-binding protein